MKLFTTEDLIKNMGLQVGDTIKFETDIWELMFDEKHNLYMFVLLRDKSHCFAPAYLLDKDFDILPRPKKVGDLLCDEVECKECPLRALCRCGQSRFSLFEIWNELTNMILDDENSDLEIYNIIEGRLNKEVPDVKDN